jgi:hypothetical protein
MWRGGAALERMLPPMSRIHTRVSSISLAVLLTSACSGGSEAAAPAPTATSTVVAPPAPPAPPPPAPPAVPPPPATPPPAEGSEASCALAEPEGASQHADLRAVVAEIARLLADEADEPLERPASEEEAAAILCGERDVASCPPNAPFVAPLTLSSSTLRAHLVVPRTGGGYFLVPVAQGNGMAARCPDEIRSTIATHGALVSAHVTTLVNELIECDEEDDEGEEDCLEGCAWSSREDREVVISPATGRFVLALGSREIGDDEGEEGVDRLPADLARYEGATVTLHGCGADRVVDLGQP